MTDIKNKVQGMEASLQSRNVQELAAKTGNIYETLNIISKRAKQISSDLKYEIQRKLEEFAESTDVIEEISENKEQIEISKYYERMPNPATIAAAEYLDDELQWRYLEKGTGND